MGNRRLTVKVVRSVLLRLLGSRLLGVHGRRLSPLEEVGKEVPYAPSRLLQPCRSIETEEYESGARTGARSSTDAFSSDGVQERCGWILTFDFDDVGRGYREEFERDPGCAPTLKLGEVLVLKRERKGGTDGGCSKRLLSQAHAFGFSICAGVFGCDKKRRRKIAIGSAPDRARNCDCCPKLLRAALPMHLAPSQLARRA